MLIEELRTWAKGISEEPTKDDELLERTPEYTARMMSGVHELRWLLDSPIVASELTSIERKLIDAGLTEDQVLRKCKDFLVQVCRIDHFGKSAGMPATNRSETKKKLAALSRKAKSLIAQLGEVASDIKDARYVPYLEKRHKAGNTDNFVEARWSFAVRQGETTIDQLLQSFASAVDEHANRLASDIENHRIVGGDKYPDRVATRYVEQVADLHLGSGNATATFIHEIITTLRGEVADVSSTRRRLKAK